MDSRSKILNRLRGERRPFDDVPPVTEPRPMVPVEDQSPEALLTRFVSEAGKLESVVTRFSDPQRAIEHVLQLIAPDKAIQAWDTDHIPLPDLAQALKDAGIEISPGDAAVRVGLTGAAAALAGTGSLVLMVGPGRPRQASLVPPVHIAVITAGQIVANLETWAASHRRNDFQAFRNASNTVVISGPSRTGDIANIPVKGVHGPGTTHIILLQHL